ncbi:Intraflagellar transport protein 27 [Blyttiomyces sp. JEL0837]|nr:Intraflagellar transport protein 27 [Blyttiomyces sp. JEL0837]
MQKGEPKATFRNKCIILGNPGVGKSSLVQVFHSDGTQYPKNYNMVGFSFKNQDAKFADMKSKRPFMRRQLRSAATLAPDSKKSKGVLIGNKADLASRRAVTSQQAEEFSKANNTHLTNGIIIKANNMEVDAPFYYVSNWFHGRVFIIYNQHFIDIAYAAEHYENSVKGFVKAGEAV